MEDVEGLHLLACGNEFDRLARDRPDRESRTSAGVTIHFGEYDSVEIQSLIEGFGGLHCVLTGHRIHYEEGFAWLDCSVQG